MQNPRDNLTHVPLQVLSEHCANQRDRYQREGVSDSRFCFELLRRAIVDQDEQAWMVVYQHYEPLVRSWIHKSRSLHLEQSDVDEIVNQAFSSFWQALTAEKFKTFDSLAALLSYLRLCVSTTVTDWLRRSQHRETTLPFEEIAHKFSDHAVEPELIEATVRHGFWQEIRNLLKGDKEQIIVHCYFIQGLKPRHIQAEYPNQFPDVNEVYRIKRNVINRLRRAVALKRWM